LRWATALVLEALIKGAEGEGAGFADVDWLLRRRALTSSP
jgi:hypothetical protein